jgi:hypothetical protein
MADRVERVTEVVEDHPVAARREVTEVSEARVTGPNLLARIIWFIAGVILALLALRFLLALLGANPASGFADFIYDASYPFVAPFFGLFSYDNIQNGASRFEAYTLVAMVVYALVAWGLARLATINRPDPA